MKTQWYTNVEKFRYLIKRDESETPYCDAKPETIATYIQSNSVSEIVTYGMFSTTCQHVALLDSKIKLRAKFDVITLLKEGMSFGKTKSSFWDQEGRQIKLLDSPNSYFRIFHASLRDHLYELFGPTSRMIENLLQKKITLLNSVDICKLVLGTKNPVKTQRSNPN